MAAAKALLPLQRKKISPAWEETLDDMLLHFTEKRDMHTLAHFRYRTYYYSLLAPTIVLSASISAMAGLFPDMMTLIASISTVNTCILSLLSSLDLQNKKDQHLAAANLYTEFRDKQWQLWMKLQVQCHVEGNLESAGAELAKFVQGMETKRAEILPNLPLIPWDIRKKVQGRRFKPTADDRGDGQSPELRTFQEVKEMQQEAVGFECTTNGARHMASPEAYGIDVDLPGRPPFAKAQEVEELRAAARKALPALEQPGEDGDLDQPLRTSLKQVGQDLERQAAVVDARLQDAGLALEKRPSGQPEELEQRKQLHDAVHSQHSELRDFSNSIKAFEQRLEREAQLEVGAHARRISEMEGLMSEMHADRIRLEASIAAQHAGASFAHGVQQPEEAAGAAAGAAAPRPSPQGGQAPNSRPGSGRPREPAAAVPAPQAHLHAPAPSSGPGSSRLREPAAAEPAPQAHAPSSRQGSRSSAVRDPGPSAPHAHGQAPLSRQASRSDELLDLSAPAAPAAQARDQGRRPSSRRDDGGSQPAASPRMHDELLEPLPQARDQVLQSGPGSRLDGAAQPAASPRVPAGHAPLSRQASRSEELRDAGVSAAAPQAPLAGRPGSKQDEPLEPRVTVAIAPPTPQSLARNNSRPGSGGSGGVEVRDMSVSVVAAPPMPAPSPPWTPMGQLSGTVAGSDVLF